MADDDRRCGAELRARRELLGLSSQETAQLLSVGERAVRGWETGTAKTVPAGVIAELAQLEQNQDDVVRELEEIGRRSGVIVIYRGDGVVPDRPELPARWHRVAAATALRNLAVDDIDVRIVYADE
ncbi:helix-turn-helix domain-containing protein [Rhodococcus marinonascens]|uniref:helix-turn-helix domain-containing protein n=1 Tax=Rhodococcus marinonascens TaxID=38311 RepID=UPI0009348646|nr:helix-turn-helix transcriptional regulator [Rhodococcus marinonascens]